MPAHGYDTYERLSAFLSTAESDARLSCVHISLFFVLFRLWLKNNCNSPISITRRSVMKFAKIKSTATYHKCISELQDFGYLIYSPTYHPANGSLVHIRDDRNCLQKNS